MLYRYLAALLLFILVVVAAELVIKILAPLLPYFILIGFGFLVAGGYIRRKRKF